MAFFLCAYATETAGQCQRSSEVSCISKRSHPRRKRFGLWRNLQPGPLWGCWLFPMARFQMEKSGFVFAGSPLDLPLRVASALLWRGGPLVLPSMPSRLKLLVLLLLASNVALGWLSYRALEAQDTKYSRLLAGSVPVQSQLQTLTATAAQAYQQTNPLLLVEPSTRDRLLAEARQVLTREQALRQNLLSLTMSAAPREDFARAGDDFSSAAFSYLEALPNLAPEEAARRRQEQVRPVFLRYLAAATDLSDKLEAESLRQSSALTDRTRHLSRLLLLGGTWPIAIVLSTLLLGFLLILFVARTSLFGSEEGWQR